MHAVGYEWQQVWMEELWKIKKFHDWSCPFPKYIRAVQLVALQKLAIKWLVCWGMKAQREKSLHMSFDIVHECSFNQILLFLFQLYKHCWLLSMHVYASNINSTGRVNTLGKELHMVVLAWCNMCTWNWHTSRRFYWNGISYIRRYQDLQTCGCNAILAE